MFATCGLTHFSTSDIFHVKIAMWKPCTKVLICLFGFATLGLAQYCYESNFDYFGNDLNEFGSQAGSAEICQVMCQAKTGCNFFSWISDDYFDPAHHFTCHLKTGRDPVPATGIVSGPKYCGGSDSTTTRRTTMTTTMCVTSPSALMVTAGIHGGNA